MTVTEASSGRHALEILNDALGGQFDVLIIDGQMPEMSGTEAALAIRRAERATGRRVPILALTAHAMKSDREACLAAGMDGYVSKPISGQLLEEAIANATGEGDEAATVKAVSQLV